MKNTRLMMLSMISLICFGLVGCNSMDRRDKNAMIGAGIGAAGGAILTDGSPLGTIGGAAAGGIIGHEMTHDNRNNRDDRDDRDYRRSRRQYRRNDATDYRRPYNRERY
jgi:osmotically inducible lipoprotein OsmB